MASSARLLGDTQAAFRDSDSTLWDSTAGAIVLALVLGIAMLSGRTSAFASPVYDSARSIAPIKVYGALFVLKGVFALVGLRRRSWPQLGLTASIGVGLYVFWASVSLFTAVTTGGAGIIGTALWAYIAGIHLLLARRYHTAEKQNA